MTDRIPPPSPPVVPARRRVDPWLIGFGLAAVLIVGVLVLTGGDTGPPSTTTTMPPPPATASEVLESARALTRAEEGLALRPYHPAGPSGVSIGYGYDMRERTSERVATDLASVEPPIQPEWIEALAEAAGLTDDAAAAFVADHGVIFLTLDQADSLFDVTYAEETALAREFATRPGTLAHLGDDYPAADWDALHPAIRGILIDLKFRGDYRPWWPAQRDLQEAVVANDHRRVLSEMRDAANFPSDLASSARFQARIDWLEWVLG